MFHSTPIKWMDEPFPEYHFPSIYDIDEMREAVRGREEFKEFDKGDHIVMNYVVNFEDTFPGISHLMSDDEIRMLALRRECRGIIFSKATGNVIRRPPHKFFNYGEREETRAEHFELLNRVNKRKLNTPYIFLEKMDGTCSVPFVTDEGRLIWGTPAGETEHSQLLVEFVDANPHYNEFARMMIDIGWTPTFEYCAMVNRVVIEHPVTRMVLTCLRNMVTGEYLPYDQMYQFKQYNIEVVDRYNFADIPTCAKYAEIEEGKEGYIVRFESGHMVKIKTEWYRALHGVVTEIRFEKDVLHLILNNLLDDAAPFLTEDRRAKFEAYAHEVHEGFFESALYIVNTVDGLGDMSKKEMAAKLNKEPLFTFMTHYFDRRDQVANHGEAVSFVYNHIRKYVAERTNSQTWINRLRFIYGNKQFKF